MNSLFGKRDLIIMLIFLAVFLGALVMNVFSGYIEPKVTADDTSITISGSYGTTIDLTRTYNLFLSSTEPVSTRKYNGYNFGKVRRGGYIVNNTEYTLYVFADKVKYIYIDESSNHYVIAFRDPTKTEALYAELVAHWKVAQQ